MPTHTQFRAVSEIGESLLSDQLEINISTFLQWGFLCIGGFYNVDIPQSGVYGGQQHRLRLSEDKNYTKGKVWEGFRRDWVWESGVGYSTQPTQISGIYVNGGFHSSSTTGTYAHKVDYPNGRVIFNSAIPASSVVTAEFAYRYCSVSTPDAPWWRKFQFDSFRVDNPDFMQYGSGSWATQNRVQLPAIVVESSPRTSRTPKELGGLNCHVKQDVLVHILAESRWDFKQIHDIVTYQFQKTLYGFDKNLLYSNDAFPLNADGSLTETAKTYPDLISDFPWKKIWFADAKSNDNSIQVAPPLLYATVRVSAEVDL